MTDIASLSAAASGLKTAYDITAEFLKQKLNAEMQGKVIELRELIVSAQQNTLNAQSAQATLAKRVEELESEIAELRDWEQEKKRYQLKDFGGETFAYTLIGEAAKGEPAHNICPSCYQKKQKSILQSRGINTASQQIFFCPACDKKFYLGAWVDPNDQAIETGSSWIDSRY